MIVNGHQWKNVIANVYCMQLGEKIERHMHDQPHTTHVIMGSIEIEIYGGRLEGVRILERGETERVLPANIEHEIRAREDGTVIVNLIESKPHGDFMNPVTFEEEQKDGGVLLDDGTLASVKRFAYDLAIVAELSSDK